MHCVYTTKSALWAMVHIAKRDNLFPFAGMMIMCCTSDAE